MSLLDNHSLSEANESVSREIEGEVEQISPFYKMALITVKFDQVAKLLHGSF